MTIGAMRAGAIFDLTSPLIGVFAASPAAYFVGGSVLKYELGLLPTTDIHPIPPAVLLGGLALAIGLNLVVLIRAPTASTLARRIASRPWNSAVLGAGLLLLSVLLGYVVVENLVPH